MLGANFNINNGEIMKTTYGFKLALVRNTDGRFAIVLHEELDGEKYLLAKSFLSISKERAALLPTHIDDTDVDISDRPEIYISKTLVALLLLSPT